VRLFVALEIPVEIRNRLAIFLKEMRTLAPQTKWIRADNLHVTLKFLGETVSTKHSAVQRALASIRSCQPVTLEIRGLGFFPSEKRPRVFWAGMEVSANLKPLAQDIDHRLLALGFPLGDRPFAPHLTLARFDPPGLPTRLAAAIAEHRSQQFGSFSTTEFLLMESKLKPTGAEYTTVQSCHFMTET